MTKEILVRSQKLSKEFIEFNTKCFSPYHSVQKGKEFLIKNGFQEIGELDQWSLKAGQKYFLTRGFGSSLVAFSIPQQTVQPYFKIIATHTDSPCIRLAPRFKTDSQGFQQAHIQVYGGGIWHTWIDRPLGVGGRVVFKVNDSIEQRLYTSSKALAVISSMCIHLKDSNPLDINKETDLRPIIATDLMR